MKKYSSKRFVANYIIEMKIPKQNKVELLENLLETKEKDINSFLLSSEHISVNDYIKISEGVKNLSEFGLSQILQLAQTATMISSLASMAGGLFKTVMSKAKAQSESLPPEDRERFMQDQERRAKQEEMKLLQQGMAGCNNKPDPDVCKRKLQAKIDAKTAELRQA